MVAKLCDSGDMAGYGSAVWGVMWLVAVAWVLMVLMRDDTYAQWWL